MKKVDMFCRRGLLLGLFVLHIFGSCVNTRVSLGVEVDQVKEAYKRQRHEMGLCQLGSQPCPQCNNRKMNDANEEQNASCNEDKCGVNRKKVFCYRTLVVTGILAIGLFGANLISTYLIPTSEPRVMEETMENLTIQS